MKGKTMFAKIFGINVLSMLVCIIIFGSTQMVLVTNYLTKQNEEYLSKNIETVVSMINDNMPTEIIGNVVNGFSSATGSYIMVIDNRGRAIIKSKNNDLVNNMPMYIDKAYTKTVLSGERNSMIGTMGNLFSETMFTLQMPIVGKDGNVFGAVSVSRPIPEHQKVKYDLFKILLMSMVIIMATSLALSYFLAKRFSVPMKNISNSTKEFAKGNFAVRVDNKTENSNILEIAELAQAFNNMVCELEKAEEIKSTFISDVSHELRTPMTTIGGFVSGILDKTIPPERQSEYLKIVHSEINRLSRLVNTFLDITRLQSDKMTMNKTNFDINELIRIGIISLESRIEEKKIDVEVELEEESCFAYADKDSIARVITNLLDNAVKFTNAGGKITVSVSTRQHEVIVSVKNTGRGISSEQIDMIFNRFYKEDKARSENKNGTGIGLYLVKNILLAHGKDIAVKSNKGEYAEFIFRLDKGKNKNINNTSQN